MITTSNISSTIVNNIEKFVEHANNLNTELVSIVFNDIDIETYQLDKNILMYAQSNIANIAKNFSLLRNNVLVLTELTIARDKAIKFIMDNKKYYPNNTNTLINVINTIAESVFYYNNDRLYTEAKVATTSIEAKYTIEVNKINKLKEEESNKNKAIELIKAFSDISTTLNDSAKKVIAGEIVSFITELKDIKNTDYNSILEILKKPPVESKKEEVIPKEDPPVKVDALPEAPSKDAVTFPTLDKSNANDYGRTTIGRVWNYINKHPGVKRYELHNLLNENEILIRNYVSLLITRGLIKSIHVSWYTVLTTVSDKYYTKGESEKLKLQSTKRAMFKLL